MGNARLRREWGHSMTNRCTTAQSTEVIRRWAPPAIVTLAATAALTALTAASPADAAPRQTPPEQTTEAAAPRHAGEPIMAIVSIKSKKVTIYDDAWMRHMLRITWNGIALHGGPLPGYAASHGCVRMPFGFAEKLFDKVPIGTRVIISPNDAEPVELSHPALFAPKSQAVAAAPARAETLAREAAEAARTADETKKAAAAAARETASLNPSLRKLEWLKSRAGAELAFADKALAAARTERATVRAEDMKQKAAPRAAELATQFDAARLDAKSKLDAA